MRSVTALASNGADGDGEHRAPAHDDEGLFGPGSAAGQVAGRRVRGIPLRAIPANVITALALCSGLTGVLFAIAASQSGSMAEWKYAVGAIVVAGVLDGVDGRVARLFRAQSRFGAELDSLSDVIAFGVSPALITYLWALGDIRQWGWVFALGFVVCAALRLARFNAAIDVEDQPHKSAGFLTGVPAPVGAGLVFLPLYLWFVTGNELFRQPVPVALWLGAIALLMISNLATFSWSRVRVRQTMRLEVILLAALAGSALFFTPWHLLALICAVYVAMLPFSIKAYRRIKQQRAAG
jgi:CDP-diacylglycerol---serine O-phosphatidyltransferase